MAFDVTGVNAYIQENLSTLYKLCVMDARSISMVKNEGGTYLTGVKQTRGLTKIDSDETTLFQDGTTCTETLSGGITAESRNLTVKNFTVKSKFCMKDFEGKALELALPPGSDYDDLGPLEQQFIALMVSKMSARTEKLVWIGDTGGAGDIAIMDGWNKIIADEIIATTIPLAQQITGATTTAAILATVEDAVDNIPEECINSMSETDELVWIGSRSAYINYLRAYKAANTAGPWLADPNRPLVDEINMPIKWVGGLASTADEAIITKMSNLAVGVDVDGEENDLLVEAGVNEKRDFVYVHGNFKLGVDFVNPEELVTINH